MSFLLVVTCVHSSDAADNTRMRQLADYLHFRHKTDPDDATLVLYSVDLKESAVSSEAKVRPATMAR